VRRLAAESWVAKRCVQIVINLQACIQIKCTTKANRGNGREEAVIAIGSLFHALSIEMVNLVDQIHKKTDLKS
jgi:hypothetical protein